MESYERVNADLVQDAEVISAAGTADRFDRLAELAPNAVEPEYLGDPKFDAQVATLRGDGSDLARLSGAAALETMGCLTRDLPDVSRRLIGELREGANELAASQVLRVRLGDVLYPRAALPRLGTRTSTGGEPPASGEFLSARGLQGGFYSMDAYFAPLLASLSPRVWGIFVSRSPSQVIIYTYGRVINGYMPNKEQLLSRLSSGQCEAPQGMPECGPRVLEAATRWWSRKLNGLLAVVSDPALFRTAQDTYAPAAHLHLWLTVNQLFRHVQSILTLYSDPHASRTVFFGLLDTLSRIDGVPLTRRLRRAYVHSVMERVSAGIPADAAEVLLPSAHRGLVGLDQIQIGFFRDVSDDKATASLPSEKRGQESVPIDQAAAEYLGVLRNATHGYGGKGNAYTDRANALLLNHTGVVPDTVHLLGYLFLLDLMADPDPLLARLAARQNSGH